MFTAGLRTLCIAVAEIPPDVYDDWKHTYYKARTSIQNREKKLDEAAELIERVQHQHFIMICRLITLCSINFAHYSDCE